MKHNVNQPEMLFTNKPNDSFNIWVLSNSNELRAGVFTGSSYSHWIMENTPSLGIIGNKWHHVVFTYDGKDMALYMNNDFSMFVKNTYFNVGDMYVSQYSVTFGGFINMNGDPVSQFKGYLDEVIFFNSALSFADVSRIFDEQKDCYD